MKPFVQAMAVFVLLCPAALSQYPECVQLSDLHGVDGVRFEDTRLPPSAVGSDVSGIGDLNADGSPDLLIGAPFGDNDNQGRGRCFVVFGGPALRNLDTLDLATLDGSNGFEIRGTVNGGFAGMKVAGGADINDDGFDDLAIGAPFAFNETGSQAGAVYVVFGEPGIGAGGVLELSSLDGSNGFTIPGIQAEAMLGGVSFCGDLNDDSISDLLLAAPCSGEPLAQIEISTDTQGVAVGDLDGDMDQDIVVTSPGLDTYSVVLNRGDGTFDEPLQFPITADPGALRLGDLDMDGDLDLAVTTIRYVERNDTFAGRISVLKNPGNGIFDPPKVYKLGELPFDARLNLDSGDLDGDGDHDLAATMYDSNSSDQFFVLWNDGTGSFSVSGPFETGEWPTIVEIADMNGDLLNDILVLEDRGDRIAIFLNDGAGDFSFQWWIFTIGSGSLAAGDLDWDGDIDVATSGVFLYFNEGGGSFREELTECLTSGCGVRMLDLDLDQDLDLIAPGSGISVFLNDGRGRFGGFGAPYRSMPLGDIAAGDLDGDLDQDIVVQLSYGSIAIVIANGDGTLRGPNAGEAYVLFGHPDIARSGVFDLRSLNGTNGFVVQCSIADALLGFSVSGAGDFNLDSIADLGITAATSNQFGPLHGVAFVLYGGRDLGASGAVDVRTIGPSEGFSVPGILDNVPIGFSMSGGGDFNGDDLPDLVIGAASSAYVIFGPPDPDGDGLVQLADLNGQNGFEVFSSVPSAALGREVVLDEDVNGDGLADLLIGAPGPSAMEGPGKWFLLYGSSIQGGALIEAESIDGLNGCVFHGKGEYARTGTALSMIGDLNGDGFAELLGGAPAGNSDEATSGGGEAYLVFSWRRSLQADKRFLSLSNADRQTFSLDASASCANLQYLLVGSLTGYYPGIHAPHGYLPLNWDGYLLFTATNPNTPPLESSMGMLDGQGKAQAAFVLAPLLSANLIGLTFRHAYVVCDDTGYFHLFSNQVPATITD